MTTAGRSFLPDSSEKTNPTRTTSARRKAVIFRVFPVVPELCEDRIGLCRQRQHRLAVAAEVFSEPLFDRFEDVLTHREITFRRCQSQAASDIRLDVEADARALRRRLHGSRHFRVPPPMTMARRLHGVNDTMATSDRRLSLGHVLRLRAGRLADRAGSTHLARDRVVLQPVYPAARVDRAHDGAACGLSPCKSGAIRRRYGRIARSCYPPIAARKRRGALSAAAPSA